MQQIPEHLPALPADLLYLGRGGTFKTQGPFAGYNCPEDPKDKRRWLKHSRLLGDLPTMHYAVPRTSITAALNTRPDAVDAATSQIALELVLTPILRTDEETAERYLRWMAKSPFMHSLDDDPTECPSINKHVAPHLNARNDEALTVLGYNRAWAVFSAELGL